MKKKMFIAIGIIALIGIMIAINIIRNNGDKILTVKTANAAREKISSTIYLDGKVDLKDKREIRSKSVATVQQVLVETGDSVKAGQALIYLDTKDLEIQRDQAKSQLDMAKDRLAQAKQPTTNPVTGQQMAPSDSAIKGADLEVRSAQAALDKINSQIADSVITSPISGKILAKNVQAGTTASPDMVLLTVGNIDNLNITTQVDEADILKVQKGQKVKITGDSFPEKEYKGEVEDIAQVPASTVPSLGAGNVVQADSTSYPVQIKILDQSTVLKPGFTANLEVITDSKDKVLVIPIEALLEKDDKQQVYVVENGVVKIKKVKTGISSDEKIEIIEGLKDGDKVILNPDEKVLKENTKVKAND